MIHLTINGKEVEALEGSTILEAAKSNNIQIPNLCYLENMHAVGSCRICVVEVKGAKTLQASCITKAAEGMVVYTNSKVVRDARKVLYELVLSDHNKDCLFCKRNQSCELQALGKLLGVEESRFEGQRSTQEVDASVSITRDLSKCILCRRCVTVCNEVQQTGVLNVQNRGFQSVVGPSMDLPIGSVACAFCGQCTVVCPVGALKETDATKPVWDALADPAKRVVVQVAPAVRVAIGEEFGYPAGSRCTGQMVSGLKALGFDDVFDTNFAADLTIMEEGTEFLGRAQNALTGGEAVLPMITSCSPGWVKYIEHNYPDCLGNLSTCKSPHTMMGAVVKSFYAEQIGYEPKDIFVVSVMPCTAKKFEIARPEMQNKGVPNVDAVLTTRELAEMMQSAGVDLTMLPDSDFDKPLGLSTGAADIFGLTGGVMEAALRTVYELVTGRELPFPKLHVTSIVGLEQVKVGVIPIKDPLPDFAFLDGVEVKVAVTSGLAGAKKLMEQIKEGTSPYHFIEIMGCPGGCITGGGQPRSHDPEVRTKRLQGLYAEDESKTLRKSHENPAIQKLYADYLGEPNGHLSHELLHTSYDGRGRYNEMTEQTYVLATEPKKKAAKPHPVEQREQNRRAEQQAADTARSMALEAENAKLKQQLNKNAKLMSALKQALAEVDQP